MKLLPACRGSHGRVTKAEDYEPAAGISSVGEESPGNYYGMYLINGLRLKMSSFCVFATGNPGSRRSMML